MTTTKEAMAAGWEAFQADELDRAEQAYRLVLSHDPSAAQAWYMLGAVCQVRGRTEEAVASYREAIRLVPDFPEACNNLGVALHAMKRYDEAIVMLRRALALRPDYAEAHNNLGNALREQDDFDDAGACYRRALELNPDYAEAHHNLGNALKSVGQMAEAFACYDRALAIKPDLPQVHLSRALARLEMGDFERGWPEYEWRLKCPQFAIPRFPLPPWDGRAARRPVDPAVCRPRPRRRDPVHPVCPDGPGSVRPGRRGLPAPLARLLATCEGVDLVVVEGSPIPDCDVYAPLMSLPGLFRTDVASIPGDVPYLSADPDLVHTWGQDLALSDELCVGIAWQGNPAYSRDRHRSFRVDRFEPIARTPGVRLYGLQKGYGSEQIAELAGRFPVIDLGGRLTDLMETAAVMMNLDLVIASDTGLAHLGGALGVPTWVALPFEPDWRWMSGRDDTPWYPTMRLFRQRRRGDWDDVFARIAAALDEPDPAP